jgi:hypothetical protein
MEKNFNFNGKTIKIGDRYLFTCIYNRKKNLLYRATIENIYTNNVEYTQILLSNLEEIGKEKIYDKSFFVGDRVIPINHIKKIESLYEIIDSNIILNEDIMIEIDRYY